MRDQKYREIIFSFFSIFVLTAVNYSSSLTPVHNQTLRKRLEREGARKTRRKSTRTNSKNTRDREESEKSERHTQQRQEDRRWQAVGRRRARVHRTWGHRGSGKADSADTAGRSMNCRA